MQKNNFEIFQQYGGHFASAPTCMNGVRRYVCTILPFYSVLFLYHVKQHIAVLYQNQNNVFKCLLIEQYNWHILGGICNSHD